MKKKIIITVPNLTTPGGVSAFWNALLPTFYSFKDVEVQTLEIGGHGKNIFGPFVDQARFNRAVNKGTDLAFINPSLGFKSFFRDGFFARHLYKKGINFVVFFHGWDLDFEKKVSKKYLTFFNKSYAKAETIFVLSAMFGDKLREWGYKGNIVIETTTIDSVLIDKFKIEKKYTYAASLDKIKILFLSRLVKEKGIYETIDAFKSLKRSFPILELIIAGDGKDYDDVLEYSKSIEGVKMVGHVSGNEKIDLFESCQIYCLPSYTEGLPTTVLEAMAFGLPIVTTPVGGLVDFFEEGRMGYLVKVKNTTDLEEKLFDLLSDSSLCEEIGRYNYTYSHTRFLNNVVADRLYNHMIKSMTKTTAN